LGLLFLFWDGGQYAFGLWLPTVAKTVTRSGIITLGLVSALPPSVGLFSILINENWSDHRGRRDWFVLWPIAVVGIGLLMGSTIPGVGAVGLVVLLASWRGSSRVNGNGCHRRRSHYALSAARPWTRAHHFDKLQISTISAE
jgi:hypothetical protein